MTDHPLVRLFATQGAIASVALSHEEDCASDVCAASHGDAEALGRVLGGLAAARDDRVYPRSET